MDRQDSPVIAVLGASGLIGEAVATALARDGFKVVAVARRFSRAQRATLAGAVECDLVSLNSEQLASQLAAWRADIVVNCIGVLQDSRRGEAREVHEAFVDRLVQAIAAQEKRVLLVHLSVPGRVQDDRTEFARTKRAAERRIAESGVAHVILRPGFVIASAAFGGSALIRALAATPFDLPREMAARPFAVTAVEDIAATIAWLSGRWRAGERDWHAAWDVMAREATTVGEVIEAFRRRLGGPRRRLRLPSWALALGARAGDLAANLGWRPPVRSTALAEMRRGVDGDPGPWSAATGVVPASLDATLATQPAGIQERWFARLYLLKPLAIAVLALFWALSGLIALTVSFDAAAAILTAHGFSEPLARAVTVVSSVIDIAIGAAIAFRRTCRAGLIVGIAVALGYMAGAAVITPALWIEPLGALVKTGPAIVLMLVALAILEER